VGMRIAEGGQHSTAVGVNGPKAPSLGGGWGRLILSTPPALRVLERSTWNRRS
jgi:hypothetical protein